MLVFRILHGIDPVEQHELLARFTEVETYRKGEAIVLKGDPGTSLFIVLSGRAQVRLGTHEVDFGAGDFLGEIAFLDGQPRSAKVLAMEADTQIAFLSQDQMKVIKAERPQLAIIILENMGMGLAAHLRRTSEALLAAGHKINRQSGMIATA